MKRDVLIIGGGGREHAIAWKLNQSSKVRKIYIAPGNGGTRDIAENVPINPTDIASLVEFAKKKKIYMSVVGPDDPLALGIVDEFQKNNLRIFGPTQAAAKIESSKAFSKELMARAGIPTADFAVFSQYRKALQYIREKDFPLVVKASGLALGKGVYVCNKLQEAENALKQLMLNRIHKEAGDEVIVEDFLEGQEISLHAFCDGTTFVPFPSAQDHKPINEGDRGKNTGGMGTIAPVPWVSARSAKNLGNQFINRALSELNKEDKKFVGILYPGLKVSPNGSKALEFNARFGDPEAQVYMRLLKTDLFDILDACINGDLSNTEVEWQSGFAACVILASGGYPDKYKKGLAISGVDVAKKVPGVVVFHAGTEFKKSLITSGGRVLGISAVGNTLSKAVESAYKAAQLVYFEGMQYRRDIGAKSINKT